jgi:hypothetical protein
VGVVIGVLSGEVCGHLSNYRYSIVWTSGVVGGVNEGALEDSLDCCCCRLGVDVASWSVCVVADVGGMVVPGWASNGVLTVSFVAGAVGVRR